MPFNRPYSPIGAFSPLRDVYIVFFTKRALRGAYEFIVFWYKLNSHALFSFISFFHHSLLFNLRICILNSIYNFLVGGVLFFSAPVSFRKEKLRPCRGFVGFKGKSAMQRWISSLKVCKLRTKRRRFFGKTIESVSQWKISLFQTGTRTSDTSSIAVIIVIFIAVICKFIIK